MREALKLSDGDQVVFRLVEGERVILARRWDLLAGSVPVPTGARGLPWDEIRRRG